MQFSKFLKDKLLQIILIFFAVATIEVFLLYYPFATFIKIYIPIILLITYIVSITIEYITKKQFYNNINNLLEEKYLIAELIKQPNFLEGQILKELLEQVDKSMIENVNNYKYLQEDYKEYIEMWIHEIKTPIATSKLIIDNNKNEITKSINEELQKIDGYTEQVLFYARSNTVEKDYYIKKSNIKDIVNDVICKNRTSLIEQKVSIDIHDVDILVDTDSKWIVFILNQIIQNSIKYRKKDTKFKIEIYAKKCKENSILHIVDNGIGIKSSEIARVFEKGFTGTNGRISDKKSTGIGLYLCKKLCNKLAIGIELSSIENEGTEVRLVFPNSSYIDMK